jgi:hypothetical protein
MGHKLWGILLFLLLSLAPVFAQAFDDEGVMPPLYPETNTDFPESPITDERPLDVIAT